MCHRFVLIAITLFEYLTLLFCQTQKTLTQQLILVKLSIDFYSIRLTFIKTIADH
jgi:hypothetical protein